MTVYCIVPDELRGKFHDGLCRHFASESRVAVVIERRATERRCLRSRRAEAHQGLSSHLNGHERRHVRNEHGRRIGDRRAPVVALGTPPLPRGLSRHSNRLALVERVVPTERYTEDLQANQLVARFQAGDPSAFEDLYSLYFDRIYGYMRAGLRDRHEAEDRVQQVFTQVFVALPRYEIDTGRPFRGWLFRVARNDLLKALQQQRKVAVADPDWLDRRRGAAAEEGAVVSTLAWLSDDELLMFVERLPMSQRQALVMRHMLGLDTREIAGLLECTVENVRQLEHRALKFLEQRLTAVGRGPSRAHRAGALVLLRQAPVLRMRRFALI